MIIVQCARDAGFRRWGKLSDWNRRRYCWTVQPPEAPLRGRSANLAAGALILLSPRVTNLHSRGFSFWCGVRAPRDGDRSALGSVPFRFVRHLNADQARAQFRTKRIPEKYASPLTRPHDAATPLLKVTALS